MGWLNGHQLVALAPFTLIAIRIYAKNTLSNRVSLEFEARNENFQSAHRKTESYIYHEQIERSIMPFFDCLVPGITRIRNKNNMAVWSGQKKDFESNGEESTIYVLLLNDLSSCMFSHIGGLIGLEFSEQRGVISESQARILRRKLEGGNPMNKETILIGGGFVGRIKIRTVNICAWCSGCVEHYFWP